MFLDEFASLLESYSSMACPLLIMGDFNFHVDNVRDIDAGKFVDLLDRHNLVQHVTEPTHTKGHILDNVITREDDANFIADVAVGAPTFSDHSPILYQWCCRSPKKQRAVRSVRRIKSINVMDFASDIEEATPLQTIRGKNAI